ncbi:MAG: hypothetical protein J6X11_01700 [Treponema sp.]|nr:hypothetical protein [Treponema sp.]
MFKKLAKCFLALGTFILFSSAFIFAQEADAPQKKQSIFMAPIYNTGDGFDTYQLAFQFGYTYENQKASALAAGFLGEDNYQFTAEGVWWPFRWSKGKMGLGTIYNITYFPELSITNNLMAGFWLETRPAKWFCLKVDTVSLCKLRTIFAIKDDNPVLVNNTFGFDLSMHFYPLSWYEFYAAVKTHELFRYNLLGSPALCLGSVFHLSALQEFAAEAKVRYTDFFTNSAMYDSCEFALRIRWLF